MSKLFLLLPFLLVVFSHANTSGTPVEPIPEVTVVEPTSENIFLPLREAANADLQSALEQELLANPTWRSLIRNKRMSVSLVDLRSDGEPRLAHLNGDHMMYAASLPKIAVLLASVDALEKGELIETQAIRQDMRLMISRSNNAATTRMIDRLGFQKIEEVMLDPAYRLYDPNYGGGLWVGKRYGSGGGRHPDPMKGISHAATSNQVVRFYYLMAQQRLVTPERCDQMMEMMVDPELHHKFVNTLDRVAPQAKVYRKSGSWRNYHSDSAMVVGPDRNYIITALIEDENGETICRELILAIERALGNNV